MNNQKRHRVEFRHGQYTSIGDLSIEWNTVIRDLRTDKFDEAIEAIDKRLYHQYADGVNIFELTDRQFNKLKKLLNISLK